MKSGIAHTLSSELSAMAAVMTKAPAKMEKPPP